MHIYFNGDSNMSGSEVPEGEHTIASTLSARLRADKSVNEALTGASNDYIYRTTVDYLKDNTPDLVVIGWTEMGRSEWLVPLHNTLQYVQLNNIGVGSDLERIVQADPTLSTRFKFWKEHQQRNKPFHEAQGWYWHEKVYNLHTMLRHMEIPHLFFHAFHTFRIYNENDQLDWHGNFIDPYTIKNTYIKWCERNGYEEITPGFRHYESAGQRAWADRLITHMNQEGIL